VLFASGKLSYFKPGETKEKNSLKVDRSMTIKKKDRKSFEIFCNDKSYLLSDVNSKTFTVEDWIEKLQMVQCLDDQ